jgi:hypothetical protein
MRKFTINVLLLCTILFYGNIQAAIVPSYSDSSILELPKKQSKFVKLDKKALELQLGRKLRGKEKIAVFLYNHKLLRPKKIDKDEAKALKWGQSSLFAAIAGWVLIFLGVVLSIPAVGLVSFFLLLFSLIYGIKSLHLKKKNNPRALFGVILSGIYFSILILALALLFIVMRDF